MNKLYIYFDDVIFRLQDKGGISYVFSELIQSKQLQVHFTPKLFITNDRGNNNIYFKYFNLVSIKNYYRIPKYLVQFMPLLLLSKKECIFHFTYYNFLFSNKKVKKVITIHDLGYEKGLMRSGLRRRINIFFKRIAIQNADGIICVSNNTKLDLEKYYGRYIGGKCIDVIYNGVENKYFEECLDNRIVDSNYLLFVGSRAKYKQFNIVVELMKLIPDRLLVIAGGGELNNTDLDELSKIAGRYIFDGEPTVEKLRNYYTYAECLIYPSRYEGFGLPIIEANSCGCRVLAGNHSSIKEISNGLNVLVNDNELSSFYYGYLQIRDSHCTSKRSLIENSRKYSSNEFQRKTIDFYRKLTR